MRLVFFTLFTFLISSVVIAQKISYSDSLPKSISFQESIDLLSAYIQRESVSGSEKEAAIFIEDYILTTDLHLRVFSNFSDNYNLAASLYPLSSGKPNIILQSHIDVVPIDDLDRWKYDPYSGHYDGSYVYGRGALDAKGLGIMQIKALEAFQHDYDTTELPYNVTVLFLSAEETGGKNGARYLMNNFQDELNAAVVLGEGGAGYQNVLKNYPDKVVFGVSVAEKQSLWLQLKINSNSAGHGAAPSNNYANMQLINSLNHLTNRKVILFFNRSTRQMFRRLGRAEGGVRGFFIRNINWSILAPFVRKQIEREPFLSSLLTNTVTVTNIYNPPGPPNQVSTSATAVLDCRLVPGTSSKSFIRYIERKLDNENIEISVIAESPEAEPSKLNKYYKAIEKSISVSYPEAETIPFLFPATSDNSLFRSYDIPSYGFIPAVVTERDINSIHGSNERIGVEVLKSGITIYYNFIKEIQFKEPFSLFNLNNDEDN
ncbi:M20/M25/M40 family metallo-hydrolase [Marivirga arenosa]|uniref:M20/M25/M40 family metallo-hydrolase n=1 Tax=Marivirga arenosa TaxID=3059076 RepID=A0AA49JAP4_9BACT|nr:M20/M25/M40 family metallo-hydrolase [Marivirga sp. BKB1-2]WKK83334.2 M20/M25/M40 family metallo-hydrolase [Marivirga sp. BKB1-2]